MPEAGEPHPADEKIPEQPQAAVTPPEPKATTPGAWMRVLHEIVITAAMAATVFLLVQFTVRNYRVEGFSMDPSLQNGELVLVNKLAYMRVETNDRRLPSVLDRDKNGLIEPLGPPRRGDVIVFHSTEEQGRFLVKRVIGLPGDTVEMRRGVVYSNGKSVDETSYIEHPGANTMAPFKVPVGHYWAMGDNRIGSSDSRSWGPLPEEKIVGRAWVAYWPLSRFGIIETPRF